MSHIGTLSFVQVANAMTPRSGPDDRSPLVTGGSEAIDGSLRILTFMLACGPASGNQSLRIAASHHLPGLISCSGGVAAKHSLNLEVDWMRDRYQSAWRRRTQGSRATRLTAILALPVALGLVIGALIAFYGGWHTTKVKQTALGAGPAASGSASATAPASAAATATGPAVTVDAANVNCDIIVPANPLTARGLSTPYQLTGTGGMSPAQSGCTMTNATALGAFVQATILDPATGQLWVYDPLVVTEGTTPAVQPSVPDIPANAIVTIDFGFNGTDLFQVGATRSALKEGNCTNGQPGSIFGQVSFCNGINFFNAALAEEREHKLVVPSAGTSSKMVVTGGAMGTGDACPVTRNFEIVDQDPSDNVTSEYLLNPATGQTAQDTASNAANIAGATLLLNGSDNTLLDAFIDPVLGCTPMMAPDLANNDLPATSQALDELAAGANQPKLAALVPENDEMVLNGNNKFDVAKTDLYREELGQAPVNAANSLISGPAMYCRNMIDIQTPFLAANQALLASGQPPVASVGDNLLTFMANRLSMSFTNLACQNFGYTNPVTVTLNGAGVAIAAAFNPTVQQSANTTATGVPGQGQRKGRKQHLLMNPSGM